jgi:hypothetical protein
MTQLLEKAIAELQKLADNDQDAMATFILDELADEREWEMQFAASQDQLARLAEKVRGDIAAGRVTGLTTVPNSQELGARVSRVLPTGRHCSSAGESPRRPAFPPGQADSAS